MYCQPSRIQTVEFQNGPLPVDKPKERFIKVSQEEKERKREEKKGEEKKKKKSKENRKEEKKNENRRNPTWRRIPIAAA